MNDENRKTVLCPVEISSIERRGKLGGNLAAETIFSLIADQFQGSAAAFVWLESAVVAGRSADPAAGADGWQWSCGVAPDFGRLVEMRIFNSAAELYIAPSGWRYRRDVGASGGDGEKIEAVDAEAPLWGGIVSNGREATDEVPTGFIRLTDSARKISLAVPRPDGAPSDAGRYLLRTRSYIGYAATGQAGYIDSRFVEIVAKGEK